MARASIDQVGSFKRDADGKPVFKNWAFDCHGDPAIKGLTYGHGPYGALEVTHVAGWSIPELEAIARDYAVLRCGAVTPRAVRRGVVMTIPTPCGAASAAGGQWEPATSIGAMPPKGRHTVTGKASQLRPSGPTSAEEVASGVRRTSCPSSGAAAAGRPPWPRRRGSTSPSRAGQRGRRTSLRRPAGRTTRGA